MSEEIRIEDTDDCEYDCDAGECIATGCERYGKCVLTINSELLKEKEEEWEKQRKSEGD